MDKTLIIFLLLLLATPVKAQLVAITTGAPPALTGIQPVHFSANVSTNGTDTSLVVNTTPSTGNTVLIMVDQTTSASVVSSVKDNLGNSYQLLCQATAGTGGNTGAVLLGIYGSLSAPSGITSFTANFTAGSHFFMSTAEYSGVTNFGQCSTNGNAGTVTTATSSITTQWTSNYNVTNFLMFTPNAPTISSGTMRLSACPSSCNVTLSGDSGAVVDNTVSTPGIVTDSVTMTSTSYGAATIELSTGTFNVVQTTGFFCTGSPSHCGQGGTTPTTGNSSFFHPVQKNDYILAAGFTGTDGTTTLSFNDSGTNTYTQVTVGGNLFCKLATAGFSTGMSYGKVGASGSLTMGMALSTGTASLYTTALEVNGLVPTSPLDQVSTCVDNTSVTTQTTGSVTPGVPKTIAFATFAASANSTWTVGSGYSFLTNAGQTSPAFSVLESKLLSSASSTNASITVGSAVELAGFMATFKAQ